MTRPIRAPGKKHDLLVSRPEFYDVVLGVLPIAATKCTQIIFNYVSTSKLFTGKFSSARLTAMDARAIKRLLFIIVASIIAIMIIKMSLTKNYSARNKAIAANKQASTAKSPAPQQAPTTPVTDEISESPTISSDDEVTTMDTSASSSVSENQ